MIPKIIHYCWFGGNPLPDLVQKCIASWKEYCPDYEIKEWNESNFDVNCCNFVREAYQAKKWAFVSDYSRLKIVYDEGGIYLDTDVELIKSLDSLLVNRCYLPEETSGYVNTGLGFGAEKNSPIIGELLQQYKGHFRLGKEIYDMSPCPRKNTMPLYKYGYKYSGIDKWESENIVVYPPEYFCPMNFETGEIKITSNTYSIHHYSALWIPDDEKKLEEKVEEMEKGTNKFFAFFIRQKMRYEFYKEKGQIKSMPEYLFEKAKKKLVNKRIKNGEF